MASLESHYGNYRIVFRFAGQKFCRTLKTRDERSARGALARLEDNLARVQSGQLLLPADADPAVFLLSDGRLKNPPAIHAKAFSTLGALLDEFLRTLTPDALEPTTEHCLRVHVRHLKRVMGEKLQLRSIDLAAVQSYIDKRAQSDGLNGKKLSPTTIRKEISTLSMIWTWARSHEYVDRALPKDSLRFPKIVDNGLHTLSPTHSLCPHNHFDPVNAFDSVVFDFVLPDSNDMPA